MAGKENERVRLGDKMSRMFGTTFMRDIGIVSIVLMIVIICFYVANINMRASRVSDTQTQSVSNWLEMQESILYGYEKGIEAEPQLLDDPEALVQYLADYTEGYEYISMSYVCSKDTPIPIYTNSGWVPGDDFDLDQKSYYAGALDLDGGVYLTSVYVDEVTGNPCLTMATKLYVDGYEAEVCLDFYLDELVALMESSYQNGQYASLIVDGVIMTDPDESYSMTADRSVDVSDTVYSHVNGKTVIFRNGFSLADKSDIEGTGWSVISVYNITAAIIGFIITIVVLIVIILLIVQMERRRVRKTIDRSLSALTSLEGQLQSFSEGRLDTNFDVQTEIEELWNLQQSLAHMQAALNGYVSDITTILTQLAQNDYTAQSGIDYQNSFAPIRASLDEIVSHLDNTFGVFHRSISDTEEVSADVSRSLADLSRTVDELTSSMQEITEKTENSVEILNRNNDELATVSEQNLAQLIEQINHIKESSDNIANILGTVNGVARQTNLLSLNASIEAARAGAAGRGFAVVADEIRELSVETTHANEEIEKLIVLNNEIVEAAIQATDATKDALHGVIDKTGESVHDLNNISEILIAQRGVFENLKRTTGESAVSTRDLSNRTMDLRAEIEKFTF
ncbi:MAG: methyl-accepting chemotaxis protein [Clostridiales bacterium]|nr:methyl-accepting chemotaxis protein [Clostridiales bacterium]